MPITKLSAIALTRALNGVWSGSSGRAECPAHDDRRPSFSINETPEGKVVFHCHAGCSQESVLDELERLGLWGNSVVESASIKSAAYSNTKQGSTDIVYPIPPSAPPIPTLAGGIKPTEVYDYTDENGNVCFKVLRFDANGRKTIRPLVLAKDTNGSMEWKWKAFPSPRPLYGRDQIKSRPTCDVLIVEGEKTANAARKLFPDMVVVTWPGGTGGVDKADFYPLKDRNVIIFPDADEPGVNAADKVADKCIQAGAARVAVVKVPPELPKAWDLADPVPANCGHGFIEKLINDAEELDPPINIFGGSIEAATLNATMLPQVIWNFAQDVAERLGVSPGAVALPAIGVIAAVIDDRIRLQPREFDTNWTERACLWVAIVAPPGYRKTPVLTAVLKPLNKIEAEWAEVDKPALDQYAQDQEIYEAKRKKYVRDQAKGSSGQAPLPLTKPKQRRKQVNDATIEALADICAENEWGVLCYMDELAGWIGSFDAYRANRGKDKPIWLQAFNGGQHLIDRQKRGRVCVANWSIGVIGGIQPAIIRKAAAQFDEDGLIQRFIVVDVENTGSGIDRVPNQQAIKDYEEALRKLANTKPSDPSKSITLSPEAHNARHAVNSMVGQLLGRTDIPTHFKGHLGKYEALFARILLVFHALECAGDFQVEQVSGSTADKAGAFLLDFLLPHAERFYERTLGLESDQDVRWIAGHLLANKYRKVSFRDLYKANHSYERKKSVVQRVMEVLTELNWVKPLGENKFSKPTRWEVNQRIYSLFAEQAKNEKSRRESIAKAIRSGVANDEENNGGGGK